MREKDGEGEGSYRASLLIRLSSSREDSEEDEDEERVAAEHEDDGLQGRGRPKVGSGF